MKYPEVRIKVESGLIEFDFKRGNLSPIYHGYDLNKLYLEIRISKIFQKILNIRSAALGSKPEVFDREDFEVFGNMLEKLLFLPDPGMEVDKVASKGINGVKETFAREFKFVTDDDTVRWRIFLSFDKTVDEIAALPWEYLRYQNQFLGAAPRAKFDLVRKIQIRPELDEREFDIPGRLNILLIIADPGTPGYLLQKNEISNLLNMFSEIKDAHQVKFNFQKVTSPTRENFFEKITEAYEALELKNEPYFIHFYGHAKPGLVALTPTTDNADKPDWVEDTDFAELFDDLKKSELPAGLFITACESGKITQFSENRGVALQMLTRHELFAVLAMQNEVVSEVVIEYMKQIYSSLLMGDDLSEAVSKGRTSLGTNITNTKKNYNNNAFGSPVLMLSTWQPVQFVLPVADIDNTEDQKGNTFSTGQEMQPGSKDFRQSQVDVSSAVPTGKELGQSAQGSALSPERLDALRNLINNQPKGNIS